VTNHKTLFDQIERWRKRDDGVCIVTFNYDRMIEAGLLGLGINIVELADYVANEHYKLIKLHGSVNWAREVETLIENIETRNVWEIASELIHRAAELKINQSFHVVQGHPPVTTYGTTALFPALAIPVENKRDFECPDHHVEVLQEQIPSVAKLLVIGWRATETPFLRMLAEGLRRRLKLLVVAGGAAQAQEIAERIGVHGIQFDLFMADSGFTEFVVRREGDEFFRA